jgi:hypothetical protein
MNTHGMNLPRGGKERGGKEKETDMKYPFVIKRKISTSSPERNLLLHDHPDDIFWFFRAHVKTNIRACRVQLEVEGRRQTTKAAPAAAPSSVLSPLSSIAGSILPWHPLLLIAPGRVIPKAGGVKCAGMIFPRRGALPSFRSRYFGGECPKETREADLMQIDPAQFICLT